jgi:hypothetical protein
MTENSANTTTLCQSREKKKPDTPLTEILWEVWQIYRGFRLQIFNCFHVSESIYLLC